MRTFILAILLALVFSGLSMAECPGGSVTVLVNKANPTDSLSMAQLRKLMLGDVRAWPDKKPVLVVRRDSASPAFQCVLTAVVRMTDAEFKRYQMNTEFRGDEAVPLKTAGSPATAIKLVGDTVGAITVVEASAAPAAGNLKVVRINGKMPGEPGYPL
jgi:ABC-type phosphate transport system substrate-binding protein